MKVFFVRVTEYFDLSGHPLDWGVQVTGSACPYGEDGTAVPHLCADLLLIFVQTPRFSARAKIEFVIPFLV